MITVRAVSRDGGQLVMRLNRGVIGRGGETLPSPRASRSSTVAVVIVMLIDGGTKAGDLFDGRVNGGHTRGMERE